LVAVNPRSKAMAEQPIEFDLVSIVASSVCQELVEFKDGTILLYI
jgi:hypothetical protein